MARDDEARAARMAAALRDNLHRRKAQARAGGPAMAAGPAEPPHDPPPTEQD